MAVYTKKVYLETSHVAAEIYRDGVQIKWEWFSGIWMCSTPKHTAKMFKLANKWADGMLAVVRTDETLNDIAVMESIPADSLDDAAWEPTGCLDDAAWERGVDYYICGQLVGENPYNLLTEKDQWLSFRSGWKTREMAEIDL